MLWRMTKAILLLPGNVLVLVPAIVLWATRNGAWAPGWRPSSAWAATAAIVIAIPALVLMVWTVRLFVARGGGGTPAPWDPIRNLVVDGPYRHVRNPMLIGVILFLVAEAIWLASWPLLAWAVIFTAVNALYFPFSEEPALLKRYGEPYAAYCRNVPRWLPRATPWTPPA